MQVVVRVRPLNSGEEGATSMQPCIPESTPSTLLSGWSHGTFPPHAGDKSILRVPDATTLCFAAGLEEAQYSFDFAADERASQLHFFRGRAHIFCWGDTSVFCFDADGTASTEQAMILTTHISCLGGPSPHCFGTDTNLDTKQAVILFTQWLGVQLSKIV
jgi:hypothetical protein